MGIITIPISNPISKFIYESSTLELQGLFLSRSFVKCFDSEALIEVYFQYSIEVSIEVLS